MRRRHFLQALSALALAPLLPHQPAEQAGLGCVAPGTVVELPNELPATWQGMLVKGPNGEVLEFVKASEALKRGDWVTRAWRGEGIARSARCATTVADLGGLVVSDEIAAGHYGWVQVQGPACVPLVFG